MNRPHPTQWGRRISDALYQGITVKIVPPSAEGVVDFRVSNVLLAFFLLVFLGISAGIVFMAVKVHNTDTRSVTLNQDLSRAQANLDEISEDIGNLLKIYHVFDSALTGVISQTDPLAEQDLAVSGGGQIQNLADLTRSLSSAIPPLQETTWVLKAQKKVLTDIPNVWPVAGGESFISMEFGPNMHPLRHYWYIHKGVDIAGPAGLAVVASASGRVVEARYEEESGYGKNIVIEHKYGFKTRYAHLAQMLVNEGDEVVQGQRIGTIGVTGLSTGPHVHFEIELGNQVLDPTSFLKISNSFKRWTGDRPMGTDE